MATFFKDENGNPIPKQYAIKIKNKIDVIIIDDVLYYEIHDNMIEFITARDTFTIDSSDIAYFTTHPQAIKDMIEVAKAENKEYQTQIKRYEENN